LVRLCFAQPMTSKRKSRVFAACLVLMLPGSAAAPAASLEDAVIRAQRPEHATATSVFFLAAQGNAHAQTILGSMYAEGRGVPQNYAEAAAWYWRAAEQGNPAAQYRLGLLFDKGLGVPLDDIEAYKWLNLAVAGAAPREREYWLKIRDAVAWKLTRSELAQAQWLALQWHPVRER
jgi:TPR repeat protein